jgi:hypothetical protein
VAAGTRGNEEAGEGFNKPDSKKQGNKKMKKLIAIAAVVVAGSMFAQDFVYDFSATLKTTKGKKGSVTVKLGKNDSGDFWYNNPAVTNYTYNANTKISETKVIDGMPVPRIVAGFLATNEQAQIAVLSIAGDYDIQSAGKWCAIYKIPGCYRVAGTRKITAKFYNDDCCDDTVIAAGISGLVGYGDTEVTNSVIKWANTTTNAPVVAGFNSVLGGPLFQFFGSSDPDKANKIELYAPVKIWSSTAQAFDGYLAGQGTVAEKANADYFPAVSGNIVGLLLAPVCENCCTPGTKSVAFDCVNDDTPTQLPYTAGFGTFRLKINKKLSQAW